MEIPVVMKLIALAMTCQFTVSVETGPAFVVTVEPAKEQPVVKPDLTADSAPDPQRRYLAFFTASWCGPCQQWKRTVMPQLQSAGYHVFQVEMTEPGNQKYLTGKKRITGYPSFVVCDWTTGKWLTDPVSGGISFDSAKQMLGDPVVRVSQPVPVSVQAPVRYIQWPGWGQIDLETYKRDCACSMCNSIRAQQAEYWRQKRAYEAQHTQSSVSPETSVSPDTSVTPDQEGCPHDVVETMLDAMELRDSDVLADLGCGDGRILIAAARRGIRSIGIEIDPGRAAVARKNIQDSGLAHLITVEVGDALDFDFGRITAATAFLYPPLLEKLSGRLSGLRVVGSPYHPIPGLPTQKHGDVWIYSAASG